MAVVAILKIAYGYNLSVDCPISLKAE